MRDVVTVIFAVCGGAALLFGGGTGSWPMIIAGFICGMFAWEFGRRT